MLYRNDKTHKLRTKIIKMCYQYEMRCINEKRYADMGAWQWFHGKWSYDEMYMKFWRRLRLRDWYSQDELERINN